MANIIGAASCVSPDTIFNTGKPLCDVSKKKIKGLILLDKGVTFSGAAVASWTAFLAELKTKTTAPRGQRAYPLFDLLNFEDGTGDPATGSVGNLSSATIITQDAVPSFKFGYNGSEARHKTMSAMNGMSLDVLLVDIGYTIYGTSKGEGVFGGYNVLQPYVNVSKFIVSDSVNQYSFNLTLADISEYRDNSIYVTGNPSLLTAQGLINASLKYLSNASNVVKIQIVEDGGTILTSAALYNAALEVLTFTAVNLQTNAAFTITSVAKDNTLNALTFTMDSTAWTALSAGDKVQINPPIASALAAGGVKPYEFLPVVITK